MQIGASTACLYPMLIEEALDTLLQQGFRLVEVFLNTLSEATPAFAQSLKTQATAADARIVATHAYLSVAEPFCLFSHYERRFRDYLGEYRRMFHAAAEMGAKFLILHGDRAAAPPLSPADFAKRYEALYDAGQEYGVTLLQENVVRFRAQSPEFVRQMRALLGEKAQFVLDLKQCRRAGVSAAEMMEAMGSGLRHLHLSDGSPAGDCLLPGTGVEDFAALFSQLQNQGYTGDGMIELYRQNFGDPAELWQGRAALLPYI